MMTAIIIVAMPISMSFIGHVNVSFFCVKVIAKNVIFNAIAILMSVKKRVCPAPKKYLAAKATAIKSNPK